MDNYYTEDVKWEEFPELLYYSDLTPEQYQIARFYESGRSQSFYWMLPKVEYSSRFISESKLYEEYGILYRGRDYFGSIERKYIFVSCIEDVSDDSIIEKAEQFREQYGKIDSVVFMNPEDDVTSLDQYEKQRLIELFPGADFWNRKFNVVENKEYGSACVEKYKKVRTLDGKFFQAEDISDLVFNTIEYYYDFDGRVHGFDLCVQEMLKKDREHTVYWFKKYTNETMINCSRVFSIFAAYMTMRYGYHFHIAEDYMNFFKLDLCDLMGNVYNSAFSWLSQLKNFIDVGFFPQPRNRKETIFQLMIKERETRPRLDAIEVEFSMEDKTVVGRQCQHKVSSLDDLELIDPAVVFNLEDVSNLSGNLYAMNQFIGKMEKIIGDYLQDKFLHCNNLVLYRVDGKVYAAYVIGVKYPIVWRVLPSFKGYPPFHVTLDVGEFRRIYDIKIASNWEILVASLKRNGILKSSSVLHYTVNPSWDGCAQHHFPVGSIKPNSGLSVEAVGLWNRQCAQVRQSTALLNGLYISKLRQSGALNYYGLIHPYIGNKVYIKSNNWR